MRVTNATVSSTFQLPAFHSYGAVRSALAACGLCRRSGAPPMTGVAAHRPGQSGGPGARLGRQSDIQLGAPRAAGARAHPYRHHPARRAARRRHDLHRRRYASTGGHEPARAGDHSGKRICKHDGALIPEHRDRQAKHRRGSPRCRDRTRCSMGPRCVSGPRCAGVTGSAVVPSRPAYNGACRV